MHFSKTIGLAFAATTIAGSAFAADLPSRRVAPAYVAPAPMFTWTGFYVGVNAGGAFGRSSARTTALPFFNAPTWDTELSASAALATSSLSGGTRSGFIGGGQIGWNYQFGAGVAGIEADIQGIAGSRGAGRTGGVLIPTAYPNERVISSNVASSSVDWLGTLRGRLGYTIVPTMLVYVTGGLAYGGVHTSATVFQMNNPPFPNDPFVSVGSSSNVRVGWTAGGGVEWMFSPSWSVKGEYLYYDLGSVSAKMSPLGLTPVGVGPRYASGMRFDTSNRGHIVRAGLNYHFNFGGSAPVVAKY